MGFYYSTWAIWVMVATYFYHSLPSYPVTSAKPPARATWRPKPYPVGPQQKTTKIAWKEIKIKPKKGKPKHKKGKKRPKRDLMGYSELEWTPNVPRLQPILKRTYEDLKENELHPTTLGSRFTGRFTQKLLTKLNVTLKPMMTNNSATKYETDERLQSKKPAINIQRKERDMEPKEPNFKRQIMSENLMLKSNNESTVSISDNPEMQAKQNTYDKKVTGHNHVTTTDKILVTTTRKTKSYIGNTRKPPILHKVPVKKLVKRLSWGKPMLLYSRNTHKISKPHGKPVKRNKMHIFPIKSYWGTQKQNTSERETFEIHSRLLNKIIAWDKTLLTGGKDYRYRIANFPFERRNNFTKLYL